MDPRILEEYVTLKYIWTGSWVFHNRDYAIWYDAHDTTRDPHVQVYGNASRESYSVVEPQTTVRDSWGGRVMLRMLYQYSSYPLV